MPEGPLGGPRPFTDAKPALKAEKDEIESPGEVKDRFDLTRNMLNTTFPGDDIDDPRLVETRSMIQQVAVKSESISPKTVVVFKRGVPGEVFQRVFEYFMSVAPNSTTVEAV